MSKMIITSSREKDLQAKQEAGDINGGKSSKGPSSSRQWSAFRNPRIVRVSRSFGGKDRHSKVCTVRGLRDRRIRLSVPTAIQLYDLQDKLGLSQPSKVIDWLLDATKYDIDKLPPLQIPQGNFGQFYQPMLVNHELNFPQPSLAPFLDANMTFIKDGRTHSLLSSKEGVRFTNNVDGEDRTAMSKSRYWDPEAGLRMKSEEVERERAVGKAKWIKISEQENEGGIGDFSAQVSAQSFFPIANHASFPGLLNNAMPYAPYYHWDPSNLSLSQFGNHGFPSQAEDPHNNNAALLQSSLALSSGSQLYFCPPTTASLFPPHPSYITTCVESDPRQINHFQLLSPSSQNILPNSLTPSLHSVSSPQKSFPLNANFKLLHSQNNDESQPNKDNTGS